MFTMTFVSFFSVNTFSDMLQWSENITRRLYGLMILCDLYSEEVVFLSLLCGFSERLEKPPKTECKNGKIDTLVKSISVF